MVKAALLFAVGLVALIWGGDRFVDGACAIARRFRVPELLIGATVVSVGTTLPEVLVSASSALGGHGEIAYGNAVGSIICNTALIAALTVAIRPQTVSRRAFRTPVIFFFCAAVLYAAVAYGSGTFSRGVGIALLSLFAVYMFVTVRQALRSAGPAEAVADGSGDGGEAVSLPRALAKLVVGAAAIAVGADLLVDNGILIARAMGVPESVIGLTFVALGTSLPELVTAVTSLIRGHGSLSLGNIIGANLFNLVLVSGLAVTLSPFSIPMEKTLAGMNASLLVDLPLMIAVMGILTLPSSVTGWLRRWQGVTLLALYAGFLVVQFVL